MQRVKEEKVVVIDFLKHGHSESSQNRFHRREPVILAIGKEHFILFELVPRDDVAVKQYDELYIGEGERAEVKFIKGTLFFDKLTQTAKTELPHVLKTLIATQESRFVDFFNNAGPISLRSHSLELLPGVGRKHTAQILDERSKAPFASFEDFKKRVTSVSNPEKVVIDRIISELKGADRHRIFVGA
tara:strand:+ start:474 stop:1034 length:561 start_codon:yes stop_codon:yes gene_type:complete